MGNGVQAYISYKVITKLETLLKFFPMPAYRNLTLQCLTEVAALSIGDVYNMQYVKMYAIFMVQLQAIVPSTTNFVEAYANGNSDEQYEDCIKDCEKAVERGRELRSDYKRLMDWKNGAFVEF